jgi:hypothetical protein
MVSTSSNLIGLLYASYKVGTHTYSSSIPPTQSTPPPTVASMAHTQDCFANEYSGGDEDTVAAIEKVARPTPGKGDPATSHVSMQKLFRDHDEVNGTETTVTLVNKHPDADRPNTEVRIVLKPSPEVVAHLVYNSTDAYKRQEIVNQYASSCAAHTNWRIEREKSVLVAKKQQQEKQEEEKLAAAYAELQKKKEVRLSVQHYIDWGCHSGYTSGERFVIDRAHTTCQPVGVPVCVSPPASPPAFKLRQASQPAPFFGAIDAHTQSMRTLGTRQGSGSHDRSRTHDLSACGCPCVCVPTSVPTSVQTASSVPPASLFGAIDAHTQSMRTLGTRQGSGSHDRSRTHDLSACGCPCVCVPTSVPTSVQTASSVPPASLFGAIDAHTQSMRTLGTRQGERFARSIAHTQPCLPVGVPVCVSSQRPHQRPFILRRVRGAVRDRSRTHDPAACWCPSVCV